MVPVVPIPNMAVEAAISTLGCPSCPISRVVRASVYDASFWSNLALVLLPLIVLAALCRGLYRIGLERERRAANERAEK